MKSDVETTTMSSSGAPPPVKSCFAADAGLRVLLFAATLTGVVVMVTSKQTEMVPVPGLPILVPLPAKFSDSPAFIYFVVALSVVCLYSLITAVASVFAVLKPASSSSVKLLFHFAVFDTVMLGLVASATGTAGGVAYIGLKGNSHVNWGKICDRYDKFCSQVGGSVAVSLFASVLLLLLIIVSVFSLYKRIR